MSEGIKEIKRLERRVCELEYAIGTLKRSTRILREDLECQFEILGYHVIRLEKVLERGGTLEKETSDETTKKE